MRHCAECELDFDKHKDHARHMKEKHNKMVLEVVDTVDDKVIHSTTCTNSVREIDRTMAGMLRNMNRDRFFVRCFGE